MAELKLMSMKRTPADKRSDQGEPAAVTDMAPDFPWGLVINMDKDELDKAGITDLPDVGSTAMMHCKVVVTRVSQSASTGPGAEEETSASFQITDLAFEEFTEPANDTDKK